MRGADLLGRDVVARGGDVLGVVGGSLRGGQIALGVLDRDLVRLVGGRDLLLRRGQARLRIG